MGAGGERVALVRVSSVMGIGASEYSSVVTSSFFLGFKQGRESGTFARRPTDGIFHLRLFIALIVLSQRPGVDTTSPRFGKE